MNITSSCLSFFASKNNTILFTIANENIIKLNNAEKVAQFTLGWVAMKGFAERREQKQRNCSSRNVIDSKLSSLMNPFEPFRRTLVKFSVTWNTWRKTWTCASLYVPYVPISLFQFFFPKLCLPAFKEVLSNLHKNSISTWKGEEETLEIGKKEMG